MKFAILGATLSLLAAATGPASAQNIQTNCLPSFDDFNCEAEGKQWNKATCSCMEASDNTYDRFCRPESPEHDPSVCYSAMMEVVIENFNYVQLYDPSNDLKMQHIFELCLDWQQYGRRWYQQGWRITPDTTLCSQ